MFTNDVLEPGVSQPKRLGPGGAPGFRVGPASLSLRTVRACVSVATRSSARDHNTSNATTRVQLANLSFCSCGGTIVSQSMLRWHFPLGGRLYMPRSRTTWIVIFSI